MKNFDWDKFAIALKNEFGSSLVEEEVGEDDAYNWWLEDVTVKDIVDFVKLQFGNKANLVEALV